MGFTLAHLSTRVIIVIVLFMQATACIYHVDDCDDVSCLHSILVSHDDDRMIVSAQRQIQFLDFNPLSYHMYVLIHPCIHAVLT